MKIIFFYGLNGSGKTFFINLLSNFKSVSVFPVQCRIFFISRYKVFNYLAKKRKFEKILNILESLHLLNDLKKYLSQKKKVIGYKNYKEFKKKLILELNKKGVKNFLQFLRVYYSMFFDKLNNNKFILVNLHVELYRIIPYYNKTYISFTKFNKDLIFRIDRNADECIYVLYKIASLSRNKKKILKLLYLLQLKRDFEKHEKYFNKIDNLRNTYKTSLDEFFLKKNLFNLRLFEKTGLKIDINNRSKNLQEKFLISKFDQIDFSKNLYLSKKLHNKKFNKMITSKLTKNLNLLLILKLKLFFDFFIFNVRLYLSFIKNLII